MFRFLYFLCGLYLNIIATDGLDTQKLIMEVNGRRIDDEIIKFENSYFDMRRKIITAGSNLNITCKIDGNDLEEPFIVFRKDQKNDTIFHCTEEYRNAPCKSVSVQINPPPGTAVTCVTNSTNKMYKFSLILNKLPFVTVSINNRILAVGPEDTELTYKFDEDENIVANCTHNTKLLSGIWNFNGLTNENNVKKINDQAARVMLTSVMNNSYIDCEDRSDCKGGSCQPAFVRLTFVAKGLLGEDNKENMLWIMNNDDKSIINTKEKNNTHIFHYKENDMIDLTCYRKPNIPLRLTWYKGNTILNYTNDQYLPLGWDSPLWEKDNGIEFKCSVDEVLGNKNDYGNNAQYYESIIKLQYDSDVTTQTTPVMAMGVSDASGNPGRYTLIFGSITLLIIIIILAFIITFLIIRSRKHKLEDEFRLQTPNSSIKSESTDSVVQVNNTYSNPQDANQEIPPDNRIYEIDTPYSTPFSETKEVYALPVPKKFRTETLKAVIDLNNKNQYYSYARKNDIRYDNSNGYENSKRPYENCNSTSDGQSSLYSEINPYL